ncbi:L,D-transpeptidase family protein [Ruminococcus albus]|uniref:Putative peptidoglycan binding domain-containing protein n=1 Tax=Ruminococcus albus TaxID=1264 RepID=A0A1I1P0N1_RUMAL|nr:L,D-transpeptidase family protein [Ruminococcus albus]SFD03132.1 Putative peptidoglycan binding domain-containing protein [Ruminococcus albus]
MENRKEDLARMIARNMSMTENFGDEPEPARGVTDFGEDAFDTVYARSGRDRRPQKAYAGSSSGSRRSTASRQHSSTASRSGSGAKRTSGGSANTKNTSGSRSTKNTAKAAAVKKPAVTIKKKKKKPMTATRAALICSCILLTGLMAGGGFLIIGNKMYEDSFLDNTYISGVDVGGMDRREALAEVKKKAAIPDVLMLTKRDGSQISIPLADIGYKDNTEEMVNKYYNGQDHGKWLSAMFDKEEYSIKNSFHYDKKKLENILAHKLIKNQKAKAPQDAYIRRNDSGTFEVVGEDDGDTIDTNKIQLLFDYVESELDELNFDIAIGSVDCYKKAVVHSDELYAQCKKLNNLHNIEIVIDFQLGTEKIDGATIMKWVGYDEEAPVNSLEVDREKVEQYVSLLASRYDTYGKDREFVSTSRGPITVPQGEGCYGWWLDQDAMTDHIIECIENCESTRTDAIYYVNPDSTYSYTCNPDWLTDKTDYGDTYFDVDLKMQHMWYYENGEMKMESDIVSGYPSESRNTPAGVYKLWLKERGKTLVGSSDGQSYASYVEFWNYFSTIGIGFHDASWQGGVFGGEKYQSPTWGSHGCVNLPYDAAQYIYENAPLDTPVFLYW